VGLLASLLVGALLVLAGWISLLFRRDPLTPRRLQGNAWQPAASSADSDALASATYGLERGHTSAVHTQRKGGLHGLARTVTLSVGAVTLLLLADLGVGLGWSRVSGTGSAVAQVVDRVNFTGNTNTMADPRSNLPAMMAYPWADDYFREIQTTPSSYWPFTESRPKKFEGTYVNIEGWSRATYAPKNLSGDAPVVWMFGGSTTWGEGQRDDYTIASYLARLAQDAGTPIRVVNYGQRGWTHFQEMILFEQLLASEPAPDVALFYDGANEINAQTLGAKGVPTHTLADQYAEVLGGSGGIDSEFAPETQAQAPPSGAQLAWASYLRNSAIQKFVRVAKQQFDTPAGASEARPSQSDSNSDNEPSTTASNSQDAGLQSTGVGQNYVKSQVDAERALDVYGRGRAMTTHLAEDYGVVPIFLWQPVMAGEAEIWANENISEPTINISDALESREDVFIDGGHTNEEGARIVAERIWAELAPMVNAPRVGQPKEKAAAVPPVKLAPTAAQMIAAAQQSLDNAILNPCELGTWSFQLGALRATESTERDQLVELAQKFLFALAEQMPPDQSALRARLMSVADQIPAQSASFEVDSARPFLRQLPVANDPEFGTTLQLALAVQQTVNLCNSG
ncbi:MAG: SGNH/GDSL hydrolase family protein, partial [Microthrixaceae bacterium]